MLLIGILIPSSAFLQPLRYGCFQQHDVIISCRIFRVRNYNTILKQARAPHIINRNHIFLQTDICCIADQRVEPLCSSADAENNRHGAHFASDSIFCVLIAFDEALHDCGIRSRFTLRFRATMRFINDEIQPVSLVLNRIIQCFPDRILPIVGMLCQLSVPTDLLGVQEIDVSILQHLHIEGFFRYGYALSEAQFIGLQLDFLLRLRV